MKNQQWHETSYGEEENFMRRTIATMFTLLFVTPMIAQSQDTAYKVKPVRDVLFKTVDGQSLKLNLFLPQSDGKIRQNAPLVIHIDSGGWNSGAPGDGGKWMELGAIQRGFAVASVPTSIGGKVHVSRPNRRRQSGSPVFCAPMQRSTAWTRHGFAAMGFSSGGHIATMLGIPDRVKTFDVGDNLDQSSHVQAVFNFFSTTSIDFMLKNNDCVDPIYNVLGAMAYKGKSADQIPPETMDLAKKCSPLTYVAKDFAPIINFNGVKDPYIPPSQGCLLHEQLLRKGAKSRLIIVNEGVHDANIVPKQELAKIVWEFLGWEQAPCPGTRR